MTDWKRITEFKKTKGGVKLRLRLKFDGNAVLITLSTYCALMLLKFKIIM